MRHLIICALAFLALAPAVARAEPPGTLAPIATGTPSGLPTPNPDAIAEAARRCFLELQAGKIDRALLSDGVTSADGHHYVIFSYSVDIAQNKVTALHFGPTSRI